MAKGVSLPRGNRGLNFFHLLMCCYLSDESKHKYCMAERLRFYVLCSMFVVPVRTVNIIILMLTDPDNVVTWLMC